MLWCPLSLMVSPCTLAMVMATKSRTESLQSGTMQVRSCPCLHFAWQNSLLHGISLEPSTWMFRQVGFMHSHMRQACSDQKNGYLDKDEMISLNAWHHIDLQTRRAIKRKFLPTCTFLLFYLRFPNHVGSILLHYATRRVVWHKQR